MKKFRKIGVLTSGGDAPGMNPCIRAITRKAIEEGVEVVGIRGGYSGLIKGDLIPLDPRSVSNIITRGGTMLYSDRCPEFKTEEGMARAMRTCHESGIDAIVALGGDGTFRGATDLTRHGIPTIGIPCTIDNDITATDYTIGYDTAMNTVLTLVDDNDMQVKWRYFLRSLGDGEINFQNVMNGIEAFLEPVWNAIVGENELLKCWKANEVRWE